MNKVIIIFLVCFSVSINLYAQQVEEDQSLHSSPVPIQVTVGNQSTLYQMIFSKQFGKNNQYTFFNLSEYELSYESETPENYLIQSIFFYNINQNFSLGTGANLKAHGGFKPLIAGAYSFFNRNFDVVIQPSIELEKDGVGEVFVLLEWHPTKNKKVNPFVSIQGLTSYKAENGNHDFSYAYLKIGAQLGSFIVGPAVNFSEAGKGLYSQSNVNVGGFLRILI